MNGCVVPLVGRVPHFILTSRFVRRVRLGAVKWVCVSARRNQLAYSRPDGKGLQSV